MKKLAVILTLIATPAFAQTVSFQCRQFAGTPLYAQCIQDGQSQRQAVQHMPLEQQQNELGVVMGPCGSYDCFTGQQNNQQVNYDSLRGY